MTHNEPLKTTRQRIFFLNHHRMIDFQIPGNLVIIPKEKLEETNAALNSPRLNFFLSSKGSNEFVDGSEITVSEDHELTTQKISPSPPFFLPSVPSNGADEINFKPFVYFLTRKTADFNQVGSALLTYINQTKQFSEDGEQVVEVLMVCIDHRDDTRIKGQASGFPLANFNECAENRFDGKPDQYQVGSTKHELNSKAVAELKGILKKSKVWVRVVDLLASIVIIPLIGVLVKTFTNNLVLAIAVLPSLEWMKFIFSSKSPLLKNTWRALYVFLVNRNPYYKLTNGDEEFMREALAAFEATKGEIWK